MLTRYCPNCGTEVDETAVFCPTCGQPVDEAAETQIPPAPAWPEPPRDVTPAPTARARIEEESAASEPDLPEATDQATAQMDEPEPEPEARPAPPQPSEPSRGDEQPADRPAPESPPAARPAAAGREEPARAPRVQVTPPVTLSGWLIGGGAAVGAVGALLGLFRGVVSPVEFLMLLALVGVALSVFAASSLPAFAHLRLVVMAVAFIGFGMALDRIGFGRANAGDLLFFLGTAAAAIGAVLVDVGQDQPLGGPRT